ncbi:MAG: adenylate cyclase [Granulosicoccus sp.]|jgi:adenylate cyclase
MKTDQPPNQQNQRRLPWHKNARLISGLILFSFVAGHLANHAVGLISIDAMEAVQSFRFTIWRNALGSLILTGSLLIHIFFALQKFILRRSWRMSMSECVQLVFGLSIPILLIPHVFATRAAREIYGIQNDYSTVLAMLWPNDAIEQTLLMLLVWVHGCIGIHFWLKFKPWYARVTWLLYGMAVTMPVLSFAGFAVASRRLLADKYHYYTRLTPEQVAWLDNAISISVGIAVAIVTSAIAYRLARTLYGRLGPTVRVTYADGPSVANQIGPTLLEISRIHGIPHASVCGGRARCSTCRVRVMEGLETLTEPDEAEQRVLNRVGAGGNVRLACQLTPTQNIKVATLLPVQRIALSDAAISDKYLWGVDQSVTVMFADIRGFTSLSENKLPYDVVFVLNQYLGQMSDAISDAGGYVDKFLGDGIMAIFGMEKSLPQGARDALAAAKAMDKVLSSINQSLAADLDKPLNIGIGIHTGPAILGRIGVKGGSGAAQRITALGDMVNTASRLESASKELACQLVVSTATIEAANAPVSGGTKALISVKGREQKVPIVAFVAAADMVIDA